MIGVVVASHGRLAEELLRTAEGVVGSLAQVRPVNVLASDPEVRHKIEEAIRAVDGGEGVLLLTDLLGGSPTQLCLSFLNERKVEVVTGVNLPMVLKLVSLRAAGKPLEQLAREVGGAGQKTIGHAFQPPRGGVGWRAGREVRAASALAEQGVPPPRLTLGNVHSANGRRQVAPSVYLDAGEIEALPRLASRGTEVEARAVPSEHPTPLSTLQTRFASAHA